MPTPHRLPPRLGALVTTTVVTIGLVAPVAGAHLDPEPTTVKPGKPAEVAFTVEHGCDGGSPTTKLTFRIPKRVKDAAPVEKAGWTATARGRTVAFEGGPLPDDTEDDFALTFTAPKKKGELRFPIIQECEEGRIRWIDTGEDAEHPPATVGVGKRADDHEDDEDDH